MDKKLLQKEEEDDDGDNNEEVGRGYGDVWLSVLGGSSGAQFWILSQQGSSTVFSRRRAGGFALQFAPLLAN